MQKEEYKEKEETERGGMVLKKVVTTRNRLFKTRINNSRSKSIFLKSNLRTPK